MNNTCTNVIMSKWINAENEVPSDSREVFVTIIYGIDGILHKDIIISHYDTKSKYWANCDSEIVTAWMEKPVPY